MDGKNWNTNFDDWKNKYYLNKKNYHTWITSFDEEYIGNRVLIIYMQLMKKIKMNMRKLCNKFIIKQ
jgi:hypothetical protein